MNVETQFARTADGAHVAYQVSGRGPLDIVFLLMGSKKWALRSPLGRGRR